MHYFDGFDAFQWFSYWGDRPIMETVAAMVFDNLFTRFPALRVGIIEHGAVWAPYALRKMDHAFMMQKATRNGKLPQRPSDVVREHFVIAPYPEERINRILEVLPPSSLVFGSDFPHPEGLPDPVTYVRELADLSEEDQRKIMSTNLQEFLQLSA
jgi:predicted TIM-barrel fold metal-dependent hydrolase